MAFSWGLVVVACTGGSNAGDGPRRERDTAFTTTVPTGSPSTATTVGARPSTTPPPSPAATVAETNGDTPVLDDERLPGAPIAARWRAVAVATGSEIIVCGGVGAGDVSSDDGAILDLASGQWRRFDAPLCAGAIDAVWIEGEMFVVCSLEQSFALSAYDPSRDSWRTILADDTRRASSMVWSDGLVIETADELVVVDPVTLQRASLPRPPFDDAGTGGLVAEGARLGAVGVVPHPSTPPSAGYSWFDRATGTWAPVVDTGQRAYEVTAAIRAGELVVAADGLDDGASASGGRFILPEVRELPLRRWIAGYGPRSLVVADRDLTAVVHSAGLAIAAGGSTLVLPSNGILALVASGGAIYAIGAERSHRLSIASGPARAVTVQAGDTVIEGERVVSMRALGAWVEVDTTTGCLRVPLDRELAMEPTVCARSS